MFRFFSVALLALSFSIAPAPTGMLAAEPASPYAGQQDRRIKALSEQDIAGLLAGKGMGFAKPAELNSYPGPLHVLELADPLQLDAAQRGRVERIFAAMKARAGELGKNIVEKERALDGLFATRAITAETLRTLTAEIAQLTGRLRAVHLAAHLELTGVLSRHQVVRYDQLRGYGGGGGQMDHGAHGSGHGG